MLASRVVILLILLIIPFSLSQSCKSANKDNCGIAGTTCQYYTWFNNTQCVFNTCTGQTTYSATIENCVGCQGATTSQLCSACTTIASKYFFDTSNNICTTCAIKYGPLCSTCNSSQCVTCTDSNQLSQDKQSCFNGQCGKQNCAVCLDSTSCQTCSGVFKLYEGNCVCGIENCQICSKESCTKCYQGFSLSANKLSCNRQCMANCEKCNDPNTCESCVVGYRYNSPTKSCVIDCTGMANCNTCSTSTSCTGCISGYQLSIKGACQAGCTDTNCAQCLTFNQCDICKTGYRLESTTCVRDVCSVQYCIKCETGTRCKECQSFFQLSSNARTCLPSCGVSKCTVCDSATTCAACEDGFKVVDGKCAAICTISNCETCRSQTVCKICSGGTVLADSGTSCIFNCGIAGCATCDSSTTCASCYPGYTLNAQKTSCIVNCVEGTYLTGSGCVNCPTANCRRCDSTGKCLRCKGLFYLDSDTFNCVACSTIANCHDCEPGKASCTQCKNTFENVGGVCVSQASCSVSNCKICVTGNNNKCSNCEDGYSTNDAGGCDQIACPGKQFLVGSTCSCGPKTYISGSSCEPCADINCLSCTASICTSCLNKYFPSGNACTACSDNCARCDSSGCLECSTGFILKSKACISPPTSSGSVSVSQTGQPIVCSPGCSQCDVDSKNNNVCLAASRGFTLVDGIVHKCDDNCRTCSDSTDGSGAYSICLSCHSGSNLIDGSCLKCTGLYATKCRRRDQAYSTACIPGYTAQEGSCKACASNCVSCDGSGSGSCDNGGCVTGFFNSEQFPTCNKCFGGCLICGSNPRQCLKCGDFLFVNSQGTCAKCISNCLSCSSATTCDTCVAGYLKVTSGVCKIPSVANCVEYDGELNCLTCDLNYNLVSGKCTASIACNADSTCTTCPYNYFLNTGKCTICPTLSNCRSCSVSSSSTCMDCRDGFYLSKGACVRCSLTGCSKCSSKQVCTEASSGYFLVSDVNGALTGEASACQGLCSTCAITAVNCLSCKDGAYAEGNQCMSKNNKAVAFTGYMKALGQSSGESSDYQIGLYISSLFTIFDQMRQALGYKNFAEFLLNVLIKSVGGGSVKLDMVMNSDPTKKDPSVLGTYPFTDVVPLKVATVVNTDTTTTTTTNSVNIPLVLGVSIPLAILLIVIIVVIKVRGSGEDDESGFDGTEKYFDENQDHF